MARLLDFLTWPFSFFIKEENINQMNLPGDCRILITATGGIGDAVLLEPFIRHLKNKFINCHIDVISSLSAKDVFGSISSVDKIIDFPDKDFYIKRWLSFWNNTSLKDEYDLAIDSKGDPVAIFYFLTKRIKKRIGFKNGGGESLLNYSLDANILVPKHEQYLMFFGNESLNYKPFLKIEPLCLNYDKPVAVIHLGAGEFNKIWSLDLWQELIVYLSTDYKIIMIGSKNDQSLDKHFSDNTKDKYLTTPTDSSLQYIMRIISGAKIFIGHDTGLTHIAAALGIKTICLFSLVHEKVIWAPSANVVLEFGGKNSLNLSVREVIQAINSL